MRPVGTPKSLRMSGYGTSRTSLGVRLESAKWGKADIDSSNLPREFRGFLLPSAQYSHTFFLSHQLLNVVGPHFHRIPHLRQVVVVIVTPPTPPLGGMIKQQVPDMGQDHGSIGLAVAEFGSLRFRQMPQPMPKEVRDPADRPHRLDELTRIDVGKHWSV